jgi:zinc resistance-associated protein
MKKLVITLTILGLVGALAIPVFAHRGDWGEWAGGPGYCWQGYGPYANLTDNQRTELDSLEQKFDNDTAKLRDQIWAKSAELNTVLNTVTPDAARARALQKEITDLRAKLDQQRIDFQLEARKVAPNAGYAPGYAGGYGWHHMMGGPYGGYGMMGGPYGGHGYGYGMHN